MVGNYIDVVIGGPPCQGRPVDRTPSLGAAFVPGGQRRVVFPGWTDGLQIMSVGEKTRFWIPEKLAYRGRKPKGMLVFDVELIEIK